MATERQIAANRLNGLKGGVKTPEGKAISCMNARKHGIFAAALTEHDAEGLRSLLDELLEELKPVGIIERLLVDKLAVTYLRMQRCARAETGHYLDNWNSAIRKPGQFRFQETVVTIGLYDARLTTQFLRLLHELEWRQEKRRNPVVCAGASLQGNPVVCAGASLRGNAGRALHTEQLDSLPASAQRGNDRSHAGAQSEIMKNEPNSAEAAPPREEPPRDENAQPPADQSPHESCETEMKNQSQGEPASASGLASAETRPPASASGEKRRPGQEAWAPTSTARHLDNTCTRG